MRARNLKPGFFKNEDLGSLPFEDRLFFAGLWCLSDREGFFEYRPKKIVAELFPYDSKITEKTIDVMTNRVMSLHLIAVQGQYGYISKFHIHQNPHPHEAKSSVPLEIKNILKKLCNDNAATLHGSAGLNPESCILNPESLLTTKPLAEVSAIDRFNQFWTAYPRKEKKQNALLSWGRIKCSNEDFEKIMAVLKRQKQSEQWLKDGGKFIPHPTNWINGKRWEEELVPEKLPSAEIKKQDSKICAANIRQTSRNKRWCEIEFTGECDFACSETCRKLEAFQNVPQKEMEN